MAKEIKNVYLVNGFEDFHNGSIAVGFPLMFKRHTWKELDLDLQEAVLIYFEEYVDDSFYQ